MSFGGQIVTFGNSIWPIGRVSTVVDIGLTAVFQNSSGIEYVHSRSVSEAVFGEVVYSLTDKLDITLGYRTSEDTKGIDIRAVYPEGGMNLNPAYHAFGLGLIKCVTTKCST